MITSGFSNKHFGRRTGVDYSDDKRFHDCIVLGDKGSGKTSKFLRYNAYWRPSRATLIVDEDYKTSSVIDDALKQEAQMKMFVFDYNRTDTIKFNPFETFAYFDLDRRIMGLSFDFLSICEHLEMTPDNITVMSALISFMMLGGQGAPSLRSFKAFLSLDDKTLFQSVIFLYTKYAETAEGTNRNILRTFDTYYKLGLDVVSSITNIIRRDLLPIFDEKVLAMSDVNNDVHLYDDYATGHIYCPISSDISQKYTANNMMLALYLQAIIQTRKKNYPSETKYPTTDHLLIDNFDCIPVTSELNVLLNSIKFKGITCSLIFNDYRNVTPALISSMEYAVIMGSDDTDYNMIQFVCDSFNTGNPSQIMSTLNKSNIAVFSRDGNVLFDDKPELPPIFKAVEDYNKRK